MDASISVGGLLTVLLAIAAVVAMGWGALMFFAAGMASSGGPEADRIGRNGCTIFVVALIVLIYAVAKLL